MVDRCRFAYQLALGLVGVSLLAAGPVLAEDPAGSDPGASVEDRPAAVQPGDARKDGLPRGEAERREDDLRRERQYWWQDDRQHQWQKPRQHWWQHPRETGQ